MTYRVLTNSRRIEKDFLRIITGFSEDEQNTIWHILRTHPKGSGETHWTINPSMWPQLSSSLERFFVFSLSICVIA
jgi:hypothetical protein